MIDTMLITPGTGNLLAVGFAPAVSTNGKFPVRDAITIIAAAWLLLEDV